MTNWPYCPIHSTPMDIVWVAGKLQFVCKACQETPLTYSTTTVSNKEGAQPNGNTRYKDSL